MNEHFFLPVDQWLSSEHLKYPFTFKLIADKNMQKILCNPLDMHFSKDWMERDIRENLSISNRLANKDNFILHIPRTIHTPDQNIKSLLYFLSLCHLCIEGRVKTVTCSVSPIHFPKWVMYGLQSGINTCSHWAKWFLTIPAGSQPSVPLSPYPLHVSAHSSSLTPISLSTFNFYLITTLFSGAWQCARIRIVNWLKR